MDGRKGNLEATLAPFSERTSPAEGAGGRTAEACDDLVRVHQRRIYRILLMLVRDRDAAETLTQECFPRAYAKGGDFRGEANVGAWLVRIALNLARDPNRTGGRRPILKANTQAIHSTEQKV